MVRGFKYVKLCFMKYTKKVFNNGLRLITVPMKGSETAIAMVMVETGSDYESKEINGLSHFLEHMCFKGTKKRTGDDIKIELDSLGSESNAFTGDEYTGYYAKARYTKIDKILDLVSDIYFNPTFPEKDINIEKGVIKEEINMYQDLPQRMVWENWDYLLYGEQPAGRSIIGPKENIDSFTQKDFIDYHNKHYVPGKTVIVVAGNIDNKKIQKDVLKKFGNIPAGKIAKKTKTKDSQKSAAINIEYKKTDQTHLILGFRSYKRGHKDNYTLKVASTILGSGFSSRLFTKMRDELGMCYYTRSSNSTYSDRGFFVVNSGVTNSRTEEAVSVIMDEFKKLKTELVDEKELKKAKDFLLGHLATGLETSDAWAEFFGFQELMREDIENVKDIEKKIKSITSKDIQRVMKKILISKNLNLAIIGPHNKPEIFEKLLKI